MEQSGIKRKISLSRKALAPVEVQGAAKAWKLALARAAHEAIGLELGLVALRQTRSSLTELLELPPERALIAVLEGPKDGLGLMVIAPDILAGIVEMQMVGHVSAAPAIVRRPTRTDATMVSALIDKALRGLEIELTQSSDLIWTSSFRYASFLEDARPLSLLLEDVPYQVLVADISLAEGAKTGQLLLALPADGRGTAPKAVEAPPSRAAEMVFGVALGEQIMGVSAEMVAVLARMQLPLDRLLNLKIGESLALGTASLDQIDLEGLNGKRLASGKLGQNRGLRAVRISDAETPAARVAMPSPQVPLARSAPDIKKAG
ncbi:FliM/FliN family flagellar motor switch protein [Pseudorhodobacter ferrugineus]|uniref:FliM/FliN family flagellar motor switch protein n=1 Tax=Pseudorhodobacter ferrugineus TaxID=77008 RepID=UPI0003B43063|nr:FliM/FliN family flagellar motor C-terminal domain-containing protein [Pseudorhodobacter ferrugineus]